MFRTSSNDEETQKQRQKKQHIRLFISLNFSKFANLFQKLKTNMLHDKVTEQISELQTNSGLKLLFFWI